MKIKKNYEYISLLGRINTDVKIEIIDDIETISYNEVNRLERIVAYKFYVKTQKKDILTSEEVKGIVYFLGVNMNKLSSYLKIDRSTLTNVIKGRKPSKMLCYLLLDAVKTELLFPNFYKSRFEKAINCDLDKEYFELLIRNKAA
ncbi:hypothetical protein [Fluviispira vulneris]|uniref:hypothetical protein n=1 Tax=Fluviispira vulneris TaxID=2763012 RepID=UPI00164539C0|nr:hypothetical protein [Fluviispira vulneris]